MRQENHTPYARTLAYFAYPWVRIPLPPLNKSLLFGNQPPLTRLWRYELNQKLLCVPALTRAVLSNATQRSPSHSTRVLSLGQLQALCDAFGSVELKERNGNPDDWDVGTIRPFSLRK